ncbi:MAG: hydrogenase maturation protein HypF [Frankiales bacterium]|nr:hydrogenase maturation protein HypF [Frankiales bacterium]
MQGVGFRPFVYGVADELGLTGLVGNDSHGVFIEAQGPIESLDALVTAVRTRPPALAVVERVSTEPLPLDGDHGFVITPSQRDDAAHTLISPDVTTCDDCLAELLDPNDRRYRYPFINCTNCGPRFTIIRGVPYDRPQTTMSGFPLCADCTREYDDPRDRRYHAQPVCCAACGPTLTLLDRAGPVTADDPIRTAADWLRQGRVLAIKGLGGYHLAALAADDSAVSALRSRKHREDKPFAVMTVDVAAIRDLAVVSDDEITLVTSRQRPIVLLQRRPDARISAAVAPGNKRIGVMLPYTALHHLLLHELGEPIVLTSGNVSDEPIAYLDDDARERLADVADGFLISDRPIHMRTDDSVTQVFRGRELPLRRSRGYVPQPLQLTAGAPRPVLACGAELKNTFCLVKGRHAVVSHHIGDLENYETFRSFTDGIAHLSRLFDITPEIVAHDLHPEYLSTKYALELDAVDVIGVQHHHAHIASCLADNNMESAVIGVACDGTGYGDDGSLWGGEFLVADLTTYERVGHLTPHPLPGGATAIREPWRMAASYLSALYDVAPLLDVQHRNAAQWDHVVAVARGDVGAPVTTSAGRLFDAVAAIVGIRDTVNYEGQAAIELEQRAAVDVTEGYAAALSSGSHGLVVDTDPLVRAVVDDVAAGIGVETVSARFHNGLADAVVQAAAAIRDDTGLGTVALSGGVFQNLRLLTRVADGLELIGFRVLLHSRVPPNDGGISFGQAAVAAARDRAGSADTR